MNKSRYKKKLCLVFLLVLFLQLAFISASLSDTFIDGKATESRQAENSSLQTGSYPAIVKIVVFADYTYYLPKVKSIDSSEYQNKISSGLNPSMNEDIKISFDSSYNMYNDWGESQGKENYFQDIQKPFSFGTGFLISPEGYILTNAHLVRPNRQLFEEWIKGYILRTIERRINIKNAAGQYSSYPDYLDDVALYDFLTKNLKFTVSNFQVRVIYKNKEYIPAIAASEANEDFSEPESRDWALLKISDNLNFSYLNLGDSEFISAENSRIIGFSSSAGSADSDYPVFNKDSLPSINSAKIPLSEGLSGAPVLFNESVIGIATYNYQDYFGGNYGYIQPINQIKPKIEPFAPLIKSESEKRSFFNFQAIKIIAIAVFSAVLLFAVLGFIIYKSRNRVSDRILIITSPKPSIFSRSQNQPCSPGRIKTYY